MKKIALMVMMTAVSGVVVAQAARDAQIKPATQPVGNANQLPNYYQNNSMNSNNSLQNNKPSAGNAAAWPGNGTYVDPTRHPAGTNQGGTSNQLPGQGPVNSANTNAAPAATGSSR